MTTADSPDFYYSEAVRFLGKAVNQTDQQAALVSFAQVFASLALVGEQRETNALLADLIRRLQPEEIIILLGVISIGANTAKY